MSHEEIRLREKVPGSPNERKSTEYRSSGKYNWGNDSSGRFENEKYVSDSERKSYVEYVNKHVNLKQPIDPESPTELFDAVAEGLLLPYF